MEFDFSQNPDESHDYAVKKALQLLKNQNERGVGEVRVSVSFNRGEYTTTCALMNKLQKEKVLLVASEVLEMLEMHGKVTNPLAIKWLTAQLDSLFDPANEDTCRQLSEKFGFDGTLSMHVVFRVMPYRLEDRQAGPDLYTAVVGRSFISRAYLNLPFPRPGTKERVYLGSSSERLVVFRDID